MLYRLCGCIVPITLPALICLTALAFKPPLLFTIGVPASFWYCVKDQSFGPVDEGEESNRIAWRALYACWVKRVAAHTVPQRRGVRRELLRRRGVEKRREAIVGG